jgi:hypothetical protein
MSSNDSRSHFHTFCCRCHGMTIPVTNVSNNGTSVVFSSRQPTGGFTAKGWDHRWIKHCPCGGPWKLEILNTA